MSKLDRSIQLYERAVKCLSGGVSSPVRAFKAVGGTPIYIERGEEAYIYDVDGNKYLDFCGSWGPLILGHAHPSVVSAINHAAALGTSFGTVHESEVVLAEKIKHLCPHIELLRFVSSGTEAVMSAIRLARGFTKRDKIIKFSGCYHGHSDYLLASAGSGLVTFGIPSSAGVPDDFAKHTLIARLNDIDAIEKLFREYGGEIAAVIIEPAPANNGLLLQPKGFLEFLREITKRHSTVLIFDEVISGFRVAPGGAAEYYNITPDLATYGKVVGGGLPVGAFGGRSEIMKLLAPLGPVYQAGTLSGNPLAMASGMATNTATAPTVRATATASPSASSPPSGAWAAAWACPPTRSGSAPSRSSACSPSTSPSPTPPASSPSWGRGSPDPHHDPHRPGRPAPGAARQRQRHLHLPPLPCCVRAPLPPAHPALPSRRSPRFRFRDPHRPGAVLHRADEQPSRAFCRGSRRHVLGRMDPRTGIPHPGPVQQERGGRHLAGQRREDGPPVPRRGAAAPSCDRGRGTLQPGNLRPDHGRGIR